MASHWTTAEHTFSHEHSPRAAEVAGPWDYLLFKEEQENEENVQSTVWGFRGSADDKEYIPEGTLAVFGELPEVWGMRPTLRVYRFPWGQPLGGWRLVQGLELLWAQVKPEYKGLFIWCWEWFQGKWVISSNYNLLLKVCVCHSAQYGGWWEAHELGEGRADS